MYLLFLLNPQNKEDASLVLLLMLLGAAFIGFMVAWISRKKKMSIQLDRKMRTVQREVGQLNSKVIALEKEKINLIAQNDLLQSDLESYLAYRDSLNTAMVYNPSNDDQETSPFQENMYTESITDDDLKKIHGVGPFIEKKLHQLGIYTFKQISEFDKEAIRKVSRQIRFFPDRIQREDWVNQAKKMME